MTKTSLRTIFARATTDQIANETLSPKTVQAEHSRRALFGFMGLASVAVAMPAIVVGAVRQTPTQFEQRYAVFMAAEARFNALSEDLEYTDISRFKREEDLYHDATDAFYSAVPTNLSELVIAMEQIIGGGSYAGREIVDRLIANARRLAEKEGR